VIPFDFAYYRPGSVQEAVGLHAELTAQGRHPLYYSGGTEIITLGRLNLLRTGAVIDIKAIPECNVLQGTAGTLAVGAAVTLSAVTDSGLFPLLDHTCAGVADRTARNKITLGGNLCSQIIYREAVLPLLVADSTVVVAGPAGVRTASIHQVFDQRLLLPPGEMLVQVQIDAGYAALPFFSRKRRRSGAIGYPVVSLAALRAPDGIRVALSGVCAFPFRSRALEAALNERAVPVADRVERALRHLPAPVLDDVEASAGYRLFVLRHTLAEALQTLAEGGT
jgi:CO/xanthine dehydrogenase FAD-binding subunit